MLAPQGSKRVALAHIRIGVNRDRGDVQLAAQRALIQRLNVFQPMLEAVAAQIDFVFRHRVEHERVVWIGRMTEGENGRIVRHGAHVSVSASLRKAKPVIWTARADSARVRIRRRLPFA